MPDLSINPNLEWTRMDLSIKQLSLIEAEAAGLLLAVQKPTHRTGAIVVLSLQLSGEVHERTKLLDSQGSPSAVAEPPARYSSTSHRPIKTPLPDSQHPNFNDLVFKPPREQLYRCPVWTIFANNGMPANDK